MRPGAKFRLRGQPFTCLRSYETIVPAKCVMLHVLESHCPECGQSFTVTTTLSRIHKRDVRRRCPDCAKPGVPVPPFKKPAKKRKAKTRRKVRRPIKVDMYATGPERNAQSAAPVAGHVSTAERTAAPAAGSVADMAAASEQAQINAYAELLG
jgi:hypothetical protein